MWWNEGEIPKQANVALMRGCTTMIAMLERLQQHPLAVGSDGNSNILILEGKVNAKSIAPQHESIFNVKLTTVLCFNLTVGYGRHNDPYLKHGQSTHAWGGNGWLSGRIVRKSGNDSMDSICC